MSYVVFIRGIPASGKTTFAKNLIRTWYRFTGFTREDLYLISKDDIRRSVCPNAAYGECDKDLIAALRDAMLHVCLERGVDVVFDETFIEVNDINAVMEQLDGQRTILFDLSNIPVVECVRRDKEREHSVGIASMVDAYRRLRDHDKRMDELVRPFDETYDGRDWFAQSWSDRDEGIPASQGTRVPDFGGAAPM